MENIYYTVEAFLHSLARKDELNIINSTASEQRTYQEGDRAEAMPSK